MQKHLFFFTAILSFLFTSCGGTSGGGNDAQTNRLKITNKCSYTIWIQQDNMPSTVPSVVKLDPNEEYEYGIPIKGLASTRFWPKKGCDAEGNNCTIGQSSDPCPTGGCPPPVDSKLEATWGCTLENQDDCDSTPQGDKITDTYWNSSAVDGYTFPFVVTVSKNTINDKNQPCSNVDCANLDISECPTTENLSEGQGGSSFPEYNSENLQVKKTSTSAIIGCYSPCKKFNYPTFGGLNINEDDDPAVIYCCPTPPIDSDECSTGPVINTKYVDAVHEMCNNTVYAYAYDDANGLRHCSAETVVSVTIGPNCP